MDEKQIKYERAKKIGLQLTTVRKEKGFTREVLAEKSNISPNYLYNIEMGNKVPNIIIFSDICNALNVSSGEILNTSISDRLSAFIKNISDDFTKLSEKEISLIENNIHFLANTK